MAYTKITDDMDTAALAAAQEGNAKAMMAEQALLQDGQMKISMMNAVFNSGQKIAESVAEDSIK